MAQLTKNFTTSELECECGCGGCEMDMEFMKVLQDLRDACGFPLEINSGFRCKEHNRKVGGAPGSRHFHGDAVDISTHGLSKEQREKLQRLVNSFKTITGIGTANSFIHIDTRPGQRVTWTY